MLPFAVFAQAPDLGVLDIVERSVPDGPIALVDGTAIPHEDFMRMYREQLALSVKGQTKLEDSDRVKLALAVLGKLIQLEVLHQEALKRGLSVSDSEVQQAYKQQLEDLQQEAQSAGLPAPAEAEVLQRLGKTR